MLRGIRTRNASKRGTQALDRAGTGIGCGADRADAKGFFIGNMCKI